MKRYRPLLNEKAENTKDISRAKPILEKVLKKIPAKFRKGANFKILKELPLGLRDAYHLHGTISIEVSAFYPRFQMLTNNETEEMRSKYSSFYISRETTYNIPTKKDNEDYSFLFLLNVVSHEIGHYVYFMLSSKFPEEFKSFIKDATKMLKNLHTATTGAYTDYYSDEDNLMSGMSMSNKDSRIFRERIAESFRLYIVEGKYKQLFEKYF